MNQEPYNPIFSTNTIHSNTQYQVTIAYPYFIAPQFAALLSNF